MKDFVKKASQKISKLSDEQVERLIDSLNAENDVLDSIVESLSTALVIVDGGWHIIKANKAAKRILPVHQAGVIRRTGEHFSGDSIRSDIHTDLFVWDFLDDETIADFLRSCAREERTNVSEEFSFTANDKTRFVSMKVLPLVQKKFLHESERQETVITGFIITADDITERRHQEILLHRMESLASLTNLAASVAHEIKNPLGAISIHIQLLQKAVRKSREGDGMLPQEKFMETYLDVINEEIGSLNKIVLDFLFAVRPVQASFTLCEPDSLVERTVMLFKPEFISKGVSVDLSLCRTSPRLLIDEKLFKEVIVNLSQNALAAILERFPCDTVDLRGFEKDGGDVRDSSVQRGSFVIESAVKNDKYFLTVADNGCGMDENTVARIFEPYYTTKADGTGLGLTMVYKVIKEFRGDIDVKSVKNHGTVFTLSLPVPQTSTMLLESKEGER